MIKQTLQPKVVYTVYKRISRTTRRNHTPPANYVARIERMQQNILHPRQHNVIYFTVVLMKNSNEKWGTLLKTQLWHQWVLTVLERWKKSPLARYVDTDIRQLSARLRWQCLRAVLLFETANVCVQVYTALPPPQPLFYSPHLSLECKFLKKTTVSSLRRLGGTRGRACFHLQYISSRACIWRAAFTLENVLWSVLFSITI